MRDFCVRIISIILFFVYASAATADDVDLKAGLVGDGETNLPLAALEASISSRDPSVQLKVLKNRKNLNELVSNLYYAEMVAREAIAMGLDTDPVVQAEIRNVKNRVLTRARLKAVYGDFIPKMAAAAEEHYIAHQEEFKSPLKVRVAHVLVRHQVGRNWDDMLKRIENIRKQALDGRDFTELVDEYSDDPSSKINHGDLGWKEATQLVKPFSDTAFSMKEKNSISAVVKTRFGYHIIKLLDRQEAGFKEFSEVKAQLIAKFTNEYRKTRRDQYLVDLKSKAKIGIEKKLLDTYIANKLLKLEALVAAPPAAMIKPNSMQKNN